MKRWFYLWGIAYFTWSIASFALDTRSQRLTVAVASSFLPPAQEIVQWYKNQTDASISISAASTGKLYAQITEGAPFDVFFSANDAYPKLLEAQGKVVVGTRMAYALGKLVLWSKDSRFKELSLNGLLNESVKRIALANPVHAPFGQAAKEALMNLGLWSQLKPKLVYGANVAQAYQYVFSGNAEVGVISLSQAIRNRSGGTWKLIPTHLYAPMVQQAVLLKDKKSGRKFLNALKSKQVKAIIRRYGYAESG